MKNHETNRKKMWTGIVVTGGILLGSLALAVFFPMTSTRAENREYASSQVVPPDKEAFALSYGEWSARWWQWAGFGMPDVGNPIADPTGAQCAVGQWGPVFFLAGTTGGPPAVRSCAVPPGKGLLIPIVNFAGAVLEDGATPEEVASTAAGAADLIDVSTLSVAIDGVTVQNLGRFRFRSPVFSFTGSSPNLYSLGGCANLTPHCYEGFRAQAVADGYWIMLMPLRPGRHTIHFHGEVPDWGFVQDVTYHLNVLKGHEEKEAQDK
jgi:hypothetical protein